MSEQPVDLRPPSRLGVHVARQICELIDDYYEEHEDSWFLLSRAASWPVPNGFNDLDDEEDY